MNFLGKSGLYKRRFHTIPDVDAERIPDNPATLGGVRMPELMNQPAWNFGGANIGLPQPSLAPKTKVKTYNSRRGPLK
jgi:hypothetical protein